jgi:hypothetical protein
MPKYLQEKRNTITRKVHQWDIPVTIIAMCFILFLSTGVNAQLYSFSERWYIGAGGGMVSFFGDLSTKDYNPVWKTQTESDLGIAFDAGKEISPVLGISASFTLGKMKGNNPDLNYYFNNKFNEIQLFINLSLKQVIQPLSNSPFDFYLSAGGGYLNYNTIRRQMDNGNIVTDDGIPSPAYSGSTRSALFASTGPGISYSINEKWKLITNLIFRFTDSDLLDSYTGSTGISDRYSMLMVGFRYTPGFSGSGSNRQIRCTEEYKKFKRRN